MPGVWGGVVIINTSWSLVDGRPVEAVSVVEPVPEPRCFWDRRFTARCPHGRDVSWTAVRSVDGAAAWGEPGCDCDGTDRAYADITVDHRERGADDDGSDGPERGRVAALAGMDGSRGADRLSGPLGVR